jgi:hypothetical protein
LHCNCFCSCFYCMHDYNASLSYIAMLPSPASLCFPFMHLQA